MANREELERLRETVRGLDLNDDAAFTAMLRMVAEGLSLLPADIAAALRVSRPTVSRWLHGVTAPHVAMREPVLGFAIRRIEALLRQQSGTVARASMAPVAAVGGR